MFTKSLEPLMNFKFEVAEVFLRHNGLVERNCTKGYKFFCEGYVHNIWVACNENAVEIKAKCYKSQKKSEEPHRLRLQLNKNNEIMDVNCSCEAG